MTERTKKIIDKLPKNKDNKLYSMVLGIVGIIILIVIIVCATTQRTYDSYSVIKSKARTDSMTKGYIPHNGNFIKYSTDGITVMGQDLKTQWSASYSMKNPGVSICEDYIAVADIGGKEILVFDKKGNAKKVKNARKKDESDIKKIKVFIMSLFYNICVYI